MNTLNNRLAQIRDKYIYFHHISENFIADPDLDTLNTFLEERESILSEISREENRIRQEADVATLQLREPEVFKEINKVLRVIAKVNEQIRVLIEKRKNTITNELAGLYGTTRAARAYTNHSRD